MKLLLKFSLPALLVLCINCKKDDSPPDPKPTTGAISGKITDSETGAAIEGANILTQPATSNVSSIGDGVYSIANVGPGQYSVSAEKTDYKSAKATVNVVAGNTATANIALIPLTQTNKPPDKPQNISPSSGTTDQPKSVTLSWSCSDPDGDDLTYEVLFSTENPPVTSIASDTSSTELDVNELEALTTYFWQVKAKDGNDARAKAFKNAIVFLGTPCPSMPLGVCCSYFS